MKLENAKITSLELTSGATITLTVGTVTNEFGELAFSHPMVQRDFENYISQYKYSGGVSHPRKTVEELKKENDILRNSLVYEIKKSNECSEQLAVMSAKENNASLCLKNVSLLLGIDEDSSALEVFDKVKEITEEWQQKYISFRAKLCDIFDPMYACYHDEDDIIARVTAVRNNSRDTERRNTEFIKANEELKDKVKNLELVISGEQKISNKLREDVNSLCDGQAELQNDLRKSEIEIAKLEKDLMDVADILQVTGPRSITDIFDKAHYWVHERSINYGELKDILRMDPDASREDILDRIEAFCRFRDDVMATFGIRDYDGSDILYELSRAALLAEKTEFICRYFDVKQIPLTSLAENICLEIKDNVISEYKAEVEAKRQNAIRDAAKKCGSLGNGVYLDGLTVEQNLRAENLRLKTECDKYEARIKELEESLDCIHCESAAALGYECE